MKNLGDYTAGKTIVCRFNTHKADGTPITLAGTPAVSVYKHSTTESTAGVTLTVDYDSKTGYHDIAIDTSADGTFYANGNDFDIVISAGTVDGVSVVGTVVGMFSLANRSALRPATADQTIAVDASGQVTVGALASAAILSIWAALTSALTTAGSIGKALVQLVTDYTTARAAKLDNLDAAVTSRMATFTLPTNFSSLSIDVSGRVDVGKWLGSTPNVLISGRLDVNAQATAASLTFNLTGNIGGNLLGTLSTTERTAIADALLLRDIGTAAGIGAQGRTVIECLYGAPRCKWSISGTTLTQYMADDVTPAFTADLTTTSATDSISASDPAGP